MHTLGYACINTALSANGLSVNRGMIRRTFDSKGLPWCGELAEKQLENSKLYDTDQFTIVEAKSSISHPGFMYFPAALRKVIFKRQTGSGIIIGQTKKSEGRYVPGTGVGSYMDSDPEPAYLEISNTYTFWVVATDMNKKVLVPK